MSKCFYVNNNFSIFYILKSLLVYEYDNASGNLTNLLITQCHALSFNYPCLKYINHIQIISLLHFADHKVIIHWEAPQVVSFFSCAVVKKYCTLDRNIIWRDNSDENALLTCAAAILLC